MFNAISDAEIAGHHVELLPARTVLSMRTAGIDGILAGSDGNSGTAGNDGGAGHTRGLDVLGWMSHADTTAAGASAADGSPS